MDETSVCIPLLFSKARDAIRENPQADQVLMMETVTGDIYLLVNHNIAGGDHRDEDSFLQMLQNQTDTQIASLVCMWNEGSVDLPSMHFRKGLLALNPNNMHTELFLLSNTGYLRKKLIETIPNS